VQLSDLEIRLLEDCHEDWRGLWEVVWGLPQGGVDEAIALLLPLVAGGYLTTLKVTGWEEARMTPPMLLDEAVSIAKDRANYEPPASEDSPFFILSITAKGEAAISPGDFPDKRGSASAL
jgi:hypothetical protein